MQTDIKTNKSIDLYTIFAEKDVGTDRHTDIKRNKTIDLYTSFADKDIKPYTLIMRGDTKSSYSPRSRGRVRWTLGTDRHTTLKQTKQLTCKQASPTKMYKLTHLQWEGI